MECPAAEEAEEDAEAEEEGDEAKAAVAVTPAKAPRGPIPLEATDGGCFDRWLEHAKGDLN